MKLLLKVSLTTVILFISVCECMPFGFVKSREVKQEILFIKDDNVIGHSSFFMDMVNLGYSVEEILPENVSVALMDQYRLVVLSAGSNPSACQSSAMRLALQSFIIESFGKVIIEGGHNGYISAVYPFYLGFRNKVIMIDDWIADNGGDLVISNNQIQSNLANNPNILPATININFVNNYYQDVCTNNKFTELFYKTSNYTDKAGILVSPTVNDPRVINYFFYYSAISNYKDAIKLLQNSIFNLIGKPVSVNNISGVIPEDFKLFQNYPNPFNPGTVISYSLPKSSFVSVRIFNVLGKEIESFIYKKQNAGNYEIYWEGKSLPSGLYYYSFSVDGEVYDIKSMLLIK